MGTRIVQLIARYVGIGLGWFGALLFGKEWAAEQAGQIADWSGAIASVAFAILSVGLSELIHRAMTGGWLTSPGEKTPAKKVQEMRTPALALLLGAGALLAFSAQGFGCAPGGHARLDAAAHDGAVTRTLDYVDGRAVGDPNLTAAARKEVLLDAALVRRAYDAALGREPTPTAFEALYPVPDSGTPPPAPPPGAPPERADPSAPSVE